MHKLLLALKKLLVFHVNKPNIHYLFVEIENMMSSNYGHPIATKSKDIAIIRSEKLE